MSTKKKAVPAARALYWSERAVRDLEAIEAYLAAQNPGAAVRWIDRLLQAAEQAAQAPLAGRSVPEVGRAEVREVFEKTYRIVYLVQEDTVVVLTVFEGHRRFPEEL
jgi:plasmid stabilization system protein ParE